MAFKIKNFYGSPLYNSSPDRPFTAEDSGDKTTPLFKHGGPHPKGPKKPVEKWSKEKCDAKRKELKDEIAKDPYSEFGSILKEQIAKHCKK